MDINEYFENKMNNNKLLLQRIKDKLPELRNILKAFSGEDIPYRFYHQSFKVYRVQRLIGQAHEIFKGIAGNDFTLNEWWVHIIEEAIDVGSFELCHNKFWLQKTRPQMEAYFHTKYLLEMIVKYGEELEEAPNILPSGWASVLYLFNCR